MASNPKHSNVTMKPGATIDLTSLGIHFTVADVYEKVVFPENNNPSI